MEPQHGDKLDQDLSAPPKPSVEVICVNDHTFKITSDQLKTSETGKSAIAFCPACGQPARVTKRNVGRLLGFKANDTKAFNAALKRIRATQLNTTPEGINAPPAPAPDLSRGKEVEIIEQGDKGEDEEYEAEEEETEFGGGKIRRLRIRDEEDEGDAEDESEDDEDDESEGEETDDEEEADDTPRRRAPKREKPKRRIIRPKKIPEEDLRDLDREAHRRQREDEEAEEEDEEEDEEESFEDRVARNRSLIDGPRRRTMIREEEFDPNKTLKEIIAESGLDEFTVERLFDYIDMQPEGWQPAQVMGMLDPWMSRSLAQRLVARYQAELYKEKVRNEKEQQMMQMIGPAAGNIRLGTPGVNQPVVVDGGIMRGDAGYTTLPQQAQRLSPQDPRAYAQRSGEPAYAPRVVPRPTRTGMTDYEVREIVADTVAREVSKFQQAMLAQQREDALRKEIDDLKKQLAGPRPMAVETQPHSTIQDKYMENQNQILTMLLKHALEGGKSDLTGALLNEVRDLKKSTEQSVAGISGANKVSDLKDIVELQRLSNDINIAKMEFDESVEGKKFTKDLIEGALQQIGQTIAQVVATRQPPGVPNTIPNMPMPMTPPPTAPAQKAPEPPVVPPGAPTEPEPTPGEVRPGVYNVKVQPTDDGKMRIPCPTCGEMMTASPGDPVVTCPKDKTHQFSLEPPKDVMDALTGKEKVPEKPETPEEKSTGKEEKPDTSKEQATPSKGQVY